ncbi:MAG: hypothetical protein AB1489_43465, partial [Acidobacteriota bacterium]
AEGAGEVINVDEMIVHDQAEGEVKPRENGKRRMKIYRGESGQSAAPVGSITAAVEPFGHFPEPGGNFLLGFLLKAPFQAELSYAGESEDGRNDIINVKGRHGLTAQLQLDKLTHLPVVLTYQGFSPIGPMRIKLRKEDPTSATRQDNDVVIVKALPAPEKALIEIRFSDHREVNGLLLPHRYSKTVNGELVEEIEIEKFEINPANQPFHAEFIYANEGEE